MPLMRWHTPRHPGTEIRDAIDAAKTAAKAALEKKESQEAVDAANTALADAMKKLLLLEIRQICGKFWTRQKL